MSVLPTRILNYSDLAIDQRRLLAFMESRTEEILSEIEGKVFTRVSAYVRSYKTLQIAHLDIQKEAQTLRFQLQNLQYNYHSLLNKNRELESELSKQLANSLV